MIHYKITPSPLDHEWHILLTFTQDDDLPIEISLPNWVPGSYLIRDFSRHITSIHASCNGTSMPLEQIAKTAGTLPPYAASGKSATPYMHSICRFEVLS